MLIYGVFGPEHLLLGISGTLENSPLVDGFFAILMILVLLPCLISEYGEPATNVYDMRLTAHEDGWIYGIFCVERKDPDVAPGDLSSAVAAAGVARTKDLVNWERLPDMVSESQQRNVVLHPEFVDGKYALYTRPQASPPLSQLWVL